MKTEQSQYKFKGSYRGRKPTGIVLHAASEYINMYGWIRLDEYFSLHTPYEYHHAILGDATVLLMQPEDKTADHAGTANHNGNTNLNTNYLGVCFTVAGQNTYGEFIDKINNTDWCTEDQFNTGLELVRGLMKKYGIEKKNIVRHSDVSGDDIRGAGKGKQDTGDGFDYVRFINNL